MKFHAVFVDHDGKTQTMTEAEFTAKTGKKLGGNNRVHVQLADKTGDFKRKYTWDPSWAGIADCGKLSAGVTHIYAENGRRVEE